MADPFTDALVSVMAASTEPMVLSDPHLPDCPVIVANGAFEALTGYPQADIIGRNCRFLQGAGTDPISTQRIRSSVAAGQGCIEWVVNHRRDGAPFWNLLFISPIFDGGKLRYFFGNQLNITNGPPPWLNEFQLGPAYMPREAEQEFHSLVAALAADEVGGPDRPGDRARVLERIVHAGRRLSELTIRLASSGD